MLGNQTHVPCVGIGVCPSAPMPGDHPLPRIGVNHMDPDKRILLRLADQLLCLVAVGWANVFRLQCQLAILFPETNLTKMKRRMWLPIK
ncbi:hypothetical protein E2C01_059098 [Portunus trituberculatus]|uniref:Uncharacterized protein n=1 Tax=Portunus trituberculatus TaxID=210409 RepID=A0A5B7H5X2_PORTR|nr:hypothetical protein [Portunus trituberculatus]